LKRRANVRPRRTRRKNRGRAWRTAGLAALLILLFVGISGSLATVAVANYYAGDLPSIDQLEAATLPQATRIYDRNGQLIDTVYDYNRTVVALAKVAKPVQQATVATEDRDFYSHQGVDWRRLAAAGLYDITHGSAAQGGSTITEQVIKNDVLTDEAQDKIFSRKLKELMLAEELERRFTKQQILELYLNSIFYGHGSFGIQAAADTYFGLQASQLDLAQSSFLVGLPQWPGEYDPFGSPDHQAAAKTRWREVLDSMVANGDVTKEQADKAFAEDIAGQMQAHHKGAAVGRDARTAHFVDYVEQYLVGKYGVKVLKQGGLRVTTTLDLALQYDADQRVKAGVAQYKSKGANTGALLAMNPLDGEILAMVGSADYNNDGIRGQVNLTGVDPNGFGDRPPGSSFKPYTYGYALERGIVTAATLVDDQHDMIGSPPHKFSDWDGKKEGMIPVRQALTESRNLPALWTYSQAGGQNVVAYARKLGVDTPVENPGSIATTLGVNPVSMAEHLAAYSAYANGGFRIAPQAILSVTDSQGRVLEQFNRAPSSQRVISPELAYLMSDLLKGPARTIGLSGKPVSAKSGTTESWTGAYFIGYTPNLALATYMAHINQGDQCDSGYAKYASGFQASGWMCPTNVLWGEHVATAVWKPFLLDYYGKNPWPADWKQPGGIVTVSVCADGSRADSTIPQSMKHNEIFMKGFGEPTQTCAAPAPPSPSPSPSPSPAPSPIPSPTPTPRR